MRKRFFVAYSVVKEYTPVTSLYDNCLFEVDFDNIHNFTCEGVFTVGQEEVLIDHQFTTHRVIGRVTAKLTLILRGVEDRTLNQIRDWIASGNDINYNNFRKSGVIRKLSEERNVIREYALGGVCPESVKAPVSSYENPYADRQYEIEFFVDSANSFIR